MVDSPANRLLITGIGAVPLLGVAFGSYGPSGANDVTFTKGNWAPGAGGNFRMDIPRKPHGRSVRLAQAMWETSPRHFERIVGDQEADSDGCVHSQRPSRSLAKRAIPDETSEADKIPGQEAP